MLATPILNKKHFAFFAQELRYTSGLTARDRELLTDWLVNTLARTNPNFDAKRFRSVTDPGKVQDKA